MAINIVMPMLKEEEINSTEFLVEDDILTISMTDLKNKMKILKVQDQYALLAALGIKVTTKAE